LVSAVLYGVATVQAWLYTERNFKDPIWLRIMVSVRSLAPHLDLAHTLFSPRLGLSGWLSQYFRLIFCLIFQLRIFETVHTALTWIFLYSLTVTNYGRPSTITDASWPLALTVPLTSFIGSTVQLISLL
jgi:hypothetical protein